MRVLIFEWLTGGGLWQDNASLDSASNMLQQGSAMVSAVGLDLSKFATVHWMVDSRLTQALNAAQTNIPPAKTTLARLAQVADVHPIDGQVDLKSKLNSLAGDADAILLIAPETDNCLANAIGWLGDEKHKLISSALDFVLATSNKNKLADRLTEHGFDQIPPGMPLDSFLKLSHTQQTDWLPIVVKPADGAGSEGIEFSTSTTAFATWLASLPLDQQSNFRVEQFISGVPASIAAVCRPDAEPTFYPAMEQILHPQPVGEYLRSEDSLSADQKRRARQVAEQALAHLPKTRGFLGFDIVLSDSDPNHDVLIEINPRITMSYLLLSQKLGDGQIARQMLN